MEKYGVVPELADAVPPQVLKVTYGDLEVNLGEELTPKQVKDKPTVTWTADGDEQLYLLCMTDPDPPPQFKEVCHWLVGNIPGNQLDKGEKWIDYIGSGPPEGTGIHRYVFLLYKQPGKLTYDKTPTSNRSRENRLNFSTKAFAQKYNLGQPVSGNFYRAQYDDYVPILRAQLERT